MIFGAGARGRVSGTSIRFQVSGPCWLDTFLAVGYDLAPLATPAEEDDG